MDLLTHDTSYKWDHASLRAQVTSLSTVSRVLCAVVDLRAPFLCTANNVPHVNMRNLFICRDADADARADADADADAHAEAFGVVSLFWLRRMTLL